MLKYEELVNTLKDEIAKGTYNKGDRLPTTPELCRIYGVSNTTVKRAMDDLELQGLVARRRGSGVYIKQTKTLANAGGRVGSSSGQMTGFVAEHQDSGHVVTSTVYGFQVCHPTPQAREALGIAEDEFVYDICRVRNIDGTPKVIEYTFMPINLIPNLREGTLEHSIYSYIEHDLGFKIGSAHRVIKAVMPTPLEQERLHVDERSPLLEVRQVGYLDDGTPFEYSTSRHTCDYEFFSISTR